MHIKHRPAIWYRRASVTYLMTSVLFTLTLSVSVWMRLWVCVGFSESELLFSTQASVIIHHFIAHLLPQRHRGSRVNKGRTYIAQFKLFIWSLAHCLTSDFLWECMFVTFFTDHKFIKWVFVNVQLCMNRAYACVLLPSGRSRLWRFWFRCRWWSTSSVSGSWATSIHTWASAHIITQCTWVLRSGSHYPFNFTDFTLFNWSFHSVLIVLTIYWCSVPSGNGLFC